MHWTDNGQRLIVFYTGTEENPQEVSVTPRLYNSIITIGPKDAGFYDDQW